VYDTSVLDQDFDGVPETRFTTITAKNRDDDGVPDSNEYYLYATHPDLFDSDGDGFGDGEEVSTGSSPLNPYCAPSGCG
jgi:hypothetical protein